MNLVDSQFFSLREATEKDIDILFQWTNDPTTRANSFHTEIIPYKDHVKWFNAILIDPQRIQLILEMKNTPVGQIRIDIDNRIGVIHYSVAPEHRGKGYGKVICNMAIQYLKETQAVDKLVAQVKTDNIASKKCFLKNDFVSSFEQFEYHFEKKDS